MNDPRLTELLEIGAWLKVRRDFSEASKSYKEKQQHFLSFLCYDDIQSCIYGFIGLCKIV